ncbi:MAG TPA: hypothetical protein VHO67_21460 [Polyangia bacterium]|nr:hypothetical protein [Polyangia bacterium]
MALGIGRVAAIAGLGAFAVACGSSAPLTGGGGGSSAPDAAPRSDAGNASDAPPSSDARPMPDAGSTDGGPVADAGSSVPCAFPVAPDLTVIAASEVLTFGGAGASAVEIATLDAGAPVSAAAFHPASSLSLAGFSGPTRVLARTTAPGCAAALFNAVYDVRATYAPAPPSPATTAVAHDDPRIVGWATAVGDYAPGPGVTNVQFTDPAQGVGPAGTDTLAVVSIGNGGSITLTFDPPIADGAGWDFAVYENGFASDIYLELAFVEVSSDGTHFARFDSAFQAQVAPGGNSSGIASQMGGLAGAYMVGYGTPFDLAALRNSPLVRDGTVDVTSVRFVRLVDIVGDGATLDSFGRPIIDPLSSGPAAGFDLDGIAVLNQ